MSKPKPWLQDEGWVPRWVGFNDSLMTKDFLARGCKPLAFSFRTPNQYIPIKPPERSMYNKNTKKDWLTASVTAGVGAGVPAYIAV
ncbi:MAG: hypothetical protein ACKO7W_04065, partial [Elainella sp.]